jgi:GrpB-like predicted nucleotidyltransferase (UPF0157 family)
MDGKLSATSAFEEWRARRRDGDPTATLIELYAHVARPRGIEPWQLPLSERLELSARALPEMWPGFEVVPGSDRDADPIRLVPYDPGWPRRFEVWRQRLVQALDLPAERVKHVGSTAVPGLLSKDTVDIQVSVDDMRKEVRYVPAIESLGVQLRSRDDLHRYFRPFAGRPRDVHVHVCDAGSEWERLHLLFVAYLREDTAARERYASEKLAAVARWADDRAAYTEAKDAVIREIEARAEDWARVRGWSG